MLYDEMGTIFMAKGQEETVITALKNPNVQDYYSYRVNYKADFLPTVPSLSNLIYDLNKLVNKYRKMGFEVVKVEFDHTDLEGTEESILEVNDYQFQ